MSTKDSIAWFKQNFGAEIVAATAGTPFDLDMLTAVALQETGFIWGTLRTKGLSRERILELCVGDTLDGRKAFPKDKADLLTDPQGQAMFDIGKAALVDMAANIAGYSGAAANPNKFCHGYGLFQYDIQFFKTDPDYFLQRKYRFFDQTLGKAISELTEKFKVVGKKLGWGTRTTLTDLEKAAVAIAYNRGSYDPAKGLKQGFKNGDGQYYGELFFDYMKLAQSVPMQVATPPAPPPPPPAPVGEAMRVNVSSSPLNVRRAPEKVAGNVFKQLSDGQAVIAFETKDGFRHIHATMGGDTVDGWVSADFLKAVAPPAPPAPPPPPPAPVGDAMVVDVASNPLNLRSAPAAVAGNIIAQLPKGQKVTAFEAQNGFRHIKTVLAGKSVDGWASAQFLKKG